MPPWVAASLVPGLVVPDAYESICNLHFRYALEPGLAGFWGVIGGMTEWVFARRDILSVTISAANRYEDLESEAIAAKVWAELAGAFGLPAEMPAHRVVWERRATFTSTPEQLARRPQTRTGSKNLVLAGDWTDTGLPATIEGAIRSGDAAAEASSRGKERERSSFCEQKEAKKLCDFGPGAHLTPGSEVEEVFCAAFFQKSGFLSCSSPLPRILRVRPG